MKLKELITLSFDRNVGAADRVFRLASGASVTAAGWYFNFPLWAGVCTSIFGLMWTATGVFSKCSIYYALGYSTRPLAAVSSAFGKQAS
jgi:hypothetical protein